MDYVPVDLWSNIDFDVYCWLSLPPFGTPVDLAFLCGQVHACAADVWTSIQNLRSYNVFHGTMARYVVTDVLV